MILVLGILLFAHLTWLGLYAVSRSSGHGGLKTLAAGLLVLSWALAFRLVYREAGADATTARIASAALLASLVVVIVGALESLLAVRRERRPRLSIFVRVGVVVPVAAALTFPGYLVGAGVGTVVYLILGAIYLTLGSALVAMYVRSQDEPLLPDLMRSYDYSFLISAIFGGQVALAMWLNTGVNATMLTLLFGTLGAAIATQVFLDRVQGFLDRIAFANVPWLRAERAELRGVASSLPRVSMTDPLTMDQIEFSRLTRRALGNFGDLTKLATSPLTNLPEVHRRLAVRDVEPTTLERARELKLILSEAIEQLRPRTGEAHGTTDEWRYYNALYYPYVVGMRPYSRRAARTFEAPHHEEVFDWFRTYVPERTLYNWQNAAAALIAGHLREREAVATQSPLEPAALLTD